MSKPVSLVKLALKTGGIIFFVVGVVSSIGWYLDNKVPSLSFDVPRIPNLFVFRFPNSFRRPYVDVVVLCITAVLLRSIKPHHRTVTRLARRLEQIQHDPESREQSLRLPNSRPESTHQHPSDFPDPKPVSKIMKLRPAPQISHPVDIIPLVPDITSPSPKDTKNPAEDHSLGNQRRSPNQKKTITRNVLGQPPTSSSDEKNPFEPVPSGSAPVQISHSPDKRKALETGGITTHRTAPERPAAQLRWPNGQGGEQPPSQEWTLQRQSALVPTTWKAIGPEGAQPFLLDQEAELPGGGDSSPASLPVASVPPWLGSEEGEELEVHDSLDATWRDITGARLLKKSGTWCPETKEKKRFRKEFTSFPRRERSMSGEELCRKAEAFIRKIRNDMRLQRQESDQQYKDMIDGGTL